MKVMKEIVKGLVGARTVEIDVSVRRHTLQVADMRTPCMHRPVFIADYRLL